ncbi:MAG: hypothetical protein JSV93_01685 [Candidatus Omnitrophota bacterium]|nr:MAG: hypothetical protein JSV93_01685 [Candidatus Omnitrophota bacterium]
MIKIVTVIDLGSNKIAGATASIDKEGNISLLALENLHSRGIRGGDITDINKAVGDIASLMDRLQCRKKPKNVFVITKSADTKMDILRGMVPLARAPREITRRDVARCLEIAAMVKFPLDRAIIEKIVRGFYIDGSALNVSNPIGLYGIKLETEAFIATVHMSKIQNITKCIDHAGFLLDGICLSGIASSESVLDEKEKKEGVLLLDIGDTLTERLIFKDSMLKSFRIMKKGAGAILNGNMRVDNNDFSSIVVTGGGALLDGVIEKTEKMLKRPARIGIVKNAGQNLSSQDAIIHTSTVGLISRIAKEYKNSHTHKNPIHKAFRKITDIYESYF